MLHTPPPVLLEFIHGLADDAATYGKLGLFSKRFGQRAERFSDWCWLLATLVGLVENGVERQMIVRLQTEGMCHYVQCFFRGRMCRSAEPIIQGIHDGSHRKVQSKGDKAG